VIGLLADFGEDLGFFGREVFGNQLLLLDELAAAIRPVFEERILR
jgi:hypothetical protein